MTEILLNYCLAFTYPTAHKGESCPLVWDLRDPPSTAAQLVPSTLKHKVITGFRHLQSQHATTPPVTALDISCDVLPYRWQIRARNKRGVTVRDVLDAIHNVTQAPLTIEEWERLSIKQQQRIERVFDVRWRDSAIPETERKSGVRRMDCLLQCTRFAGLSMSYDNDFRCILTLSRSTE